MGTLHIAPTDSAGGSLRKAVRDAGRDDEVLAFRDSLNCGPIDSDDPASRAMWWAPSYDAAETERVLRQFWDRVTTTTDRLVVWFGRHHAGELAFFHALAERLGRRPYEIVDVTGLELPFVRRDGTPALSYPKQSVGTISDADLRRLLGSERPIGADEARQYADRWRQLKQENAYFRVVEATGLSSAPIDYFDRLILEQATVVWNRSISVISDTIGYNSEPYVQTGDVMLLTRIVALVEQGKLLADGDPRDMLACRIRLPV
ncbi:DUF3658 domain-containing protein [Methylopila sp. M107]|uniref:DUF3658 domain-containing protein n=1 Tax=Methylopila sp. M107 TaxID=1101190 RepID=UPI0009DBC9CD|nr:DUF3658 domain-containing protein [Methylopila sp. M107]